MPVVGHLHCFGGKAQLPDKSSDFVKIECRAQRIVEHLPLVFVGTGRVCFYQVAYRTVIGWTAKIAEENQPVGRRHADGLA